MQYEQAFERINTILQKARHLGWRDSKKNSISPSVTVEQHINHIREACQDAWDPTFAESYIERLEEQLDGNVPVGLFGTNISSEFLLH